MPAKPRAIDSAFTRSPAHGVKMFWRCFLQSFVGIQLCLSATLDYVQETLPIDASDVTWYHATNSKNKLNEALEGPVMFLEADVSLGRVIGTNTLEKVPIMAHPPLAISDISLEDWILEIVNRGNNTKGVKLDFKSTNIINASLSILEKLNSQISFPLWLNADILPGPVNATATPVDAETFFSLCRTYFPKATLSIGWTTLDDGKAEDQRYSWNNVWTMARAIRCAEVHKDTPLTFPIRGIFVKRSMPQLLWLVRTFPSSGITIWSGLLDNLDLESLMDLRRALPLSSVYYDLPSHIMKDFLEMKENVTYEEDSTLKYNTFGVLRDSDEPFGCDDTTSVMSDVIVYGGRRTVAVFENKPYALPIRVSGNLYPYDLSDYDGEFSTREGVISVIASTSKEFWSEGAWRDQYNSTLLAIGVGDPDHIQSCCSVKFAVHYKLGEVVPTDDISVESCHNHETCKMYTDQSSFDVPLGNMDLVYIGFVFRGERAMVVTDVNISGQEIRSGQMSNGLNQFDALLVFALLVWLRMFLF